MSYVRHSLEKIVGTEDAKGPKYTAHYLVTMDDPDDHCLTVTEAMPWRLFQVYDIGNDYDPRAVVLSAAASPVAGNNYRWNYTVEFGVPEREDQNNDNPLAEPPSVEMVFAQGEKLLERDVNGKFIRNTVGDRFDDIITREDSQPILRIVRNEPRSNALFGVDFRDCINRSAWMGAAKRTVKFQPPSLRWKYHQRIGTYVEKSYEFKFSDTTWRFILLNQGYYERIQDPDTGRGTGNAIAYTRRRIKDNDDNDMQQPIALTQSGLVLPDDESPVWLEFDGYREINFPNMGINL